MKHSEETWSEIRRLVRAGHNNAAIVRELGIHPDSIRKVRRELELPNAPSWMQTAAPLARGVPLFQDPEEHEGPVPPPGPDLIYAVRPSLALWQVLIRRGSRHDLKRCARVVRRVLGLHHDAGDDAVAMAAIADSRTAEELATAYLRAWSG